MKPEILSLVLLPTWVYVSTFCDWRPAEHSSLPPVSKARPIVVSVVDISQMGGGGEIEFEDLDGVSTVKVVGYIVLFYNNTQMQTRYVSVIALLCSLSVFA